MSSSAGASAAAASGAPAIKVDTTGDFVVYGTPHYVVACAKGFPMIAHLGIDSGGRGRRPIDNTLLRPGLGGTVVCDGKDSFGVACAGALGASEIRYERIPFDAGAERNCTVAARDARTFAVRVEGVKGLVQGEFFQLATAPDVAPATIWAVRSEVKPTPRHDRAKSFFSPRVIATAWQLPAVLHFPDYGLVKVEASAPDIHMQAHIIPDCTNAGLAVGAYNRSIHSAFRAYTLGTVLLSFHAEEGVGTAEITFTVLAENYPKIQGCDFSDAKFDGLKRCWQNNFTVNPEQQCMGDNLLINGIAQLSMAFKADVAVFAPPVPGRESMREALWRALAETFAKRVKEDDGRIHDYAWESNEVCLIALYDYLLISGDWQFVRDNLPNIRRAAKSTLNCDIDGDGILQAPFDGNRFVPGRRESLNWWDDFAFGHKDAYLNLMAYRAMRHMREVFEVLGLDEDVKAIDAHQARFRANFDKVFYNPKTGAYAGWISRDGNVHDYMFTFVSAMAINEGLVPVDRARAILTMMLTRMKELGYDYVYGVPGPLIPVDPADRGSWDAMSRWGVYENGGLCGQTAYHFIQALYNVGMREQADHILFTMMDTFEREPTHSGLFPGYLRSVDWRTKGGVPCGYNYLADNYYFLLAAVTGHYGIKFPALPKP